LELLDIIILPILLPTKEAHVILIVKYLLHECYILPKKKFRRIALAEQ